MPFIMNIKFFNEELEEGVKMTQDDFVHICENLKFKYYSAGDIVIKKDDYGSTFYVILSGTVQVLVPKNKVKKNNAMNRKYDNNEPKKRHTPSKTKTILTQENESLSINRSRIHKSRQEDGAQDKPPEIEETNEEKTLSRYTNQDEYEHSDSTSNTKSISSMNSF